LDRNVRPTGLIFNARNRSGGRLLEILMRFHPFDTKLKRWLIVLAGVIWMWYLLGPGLEWLASIAVRPDPVRTDHVQASAPRLWHVVTTSGAIFESKQACITVFCSPASIVQNSVISVVWTPGMHSMSEAFREGVSRTMETEGYSIRTVRSVEGASGIFQCIEGTRGRPSVVKSSCYALQSDLRADFDGEAMDLGAFYAILRTARSH
jgi:hypothetical protein